MRRSVSSYGITGSWIIAFQAETNGEGLSFVTLGFTMARRIRVIRSKGGVDDVKCVPKDQAPATAGNDQSALCGCSGFTSFDGTGIRWARLLLAIMKP
jgi:hypothetical protein